MATSFWLGHQMCTAPEITAHYLHTSTQNIKPWCALTCCAVLWRAESSITFDDVTVVINSCRVNVASFDPVNNMPQLGPQVTLAL
jgi:hypothetical protein